MQFTKSADVLKALEALALAETSYPSIETYISRGGAMFGEERRRLVTLGQRLREQGYELRYSEPFPPGNPPELPADAVVWKIERQLVLDRYVYAVRKRDVSE